MRLEVAGAPLVSRTIQEVVAVSGRDVSLEAEFCSDPVPLRNTWQWGSVVLPAGSELGGKYRAELVEHPQVQIAPLHFVHFGYLVHFVHLLVVHLVHSVHFVHFIHSVNFVHFVHFVHCKPYV